MKFGVREICDVVLKAKANQKVGDKIFYKNEPVIYFDTLKTSSMEGAATTVYAQGGRGNARLMAWEGERTITFTMEDALISPAGFMILSGAGLIDATEKTLQVHTTEQTDAVKVSGNTVTITLQEEPYESDDGENYIYVMLMENGEVVSEPYIPQSVSGKDVTLKTTDDLVHFKNGSVVLVDYYVSRDGGAQQIEITPDKFGGNYYLEASTLFRDTNGVDMPAEFIIPNCKIQSNFSFTMASSGDPSTFTFTMDAFPDYTRFDKTKKVLAAIQIVSSGADDAGADLTRERTRTERAADKNGMIVESDSVRYSLVTQDDAVAGETMTFSVVPAPTGTVKWGVIGNNKTGTTISNGVLTIADDESGTLIVAADIDNDLAYKKVIVAAG